MCTGCSCGAAAPTRPSLIFGYVWYVCTGDGNRAFLSETVQIGETMAFLGHGLDEMDLAIEIARV